MVVARDTIGNKLPAALPEAHIEAWTGRLEPVELPLGDVVYEPGKKLSHVVFPTSAIVSLRYVMENGGPAQIAIVGNESIAGVSLFMGR